jgi:hypothetical protein
MSMRRLCSWLSAGVVWAGIVSAGIVSACGPSPPPARYAGDHARDFVREHRAELEAEINTGSGPRLYDLAIVANCQDVPALGRRLHKQRANLFAVAPATGAPPSDEEVAERVVRFMSENGTSSSGTPNSGELRCLFLETGRQSELAGGRRDIGPGRGPTTARGGTP